MSNRISKKNIKSLIHFYEEKLKDLEKKGKCMADENAKNKHFLYDLTEHYFKEERVRGNIEAAKYILNNC